MLPYLAFALSDLPLAGQKMLARHSDANIRTALATSSTTHSEVIDYLLEDSNHDVWVPAMARTTNIEILVEHGFGMFNARFARSPVGIAAKSAACRNPLTPPDKLAQALTSSDDIVAFLALINPATPLESREILSRSDIAKRFCNPRIVGSALQTFEIVNANPWLADIQRIVDPIDDTERQADHTMRSHLEAIESPEFTLSDAATLLRSNRIAEPQIIGRLVNRYGFGTLYTEMGHSALWHSEEFNSAALIAPIIECVQDYRVFYTLSRERAQSFRDAKLTCETLGDSPHNWETFANVISDWHGDFTDAALVAAKL